jgi:hypothetical protein
MRACQILELVIFIEELLASGPFGPWDGFLVWVFVLLNERDYLSKQPVPDLTDKRLSV